MSSSGANVEGTTTTNPERPVEQPRPEAPKKKPRGSSKTRQDSFEEEMTGFETKLTRMEYAVGDVNDDLVEIKAFMETADGRMTTLEEAGDELQDQMLMALNGAMDAVHKKEATLEAKDKDLEAQVATLARTVEELKCQLEQIRSAGASGGVVHFPGSAKPKVPRPDAYEGARSAREIDNFLWNLERYFDAIGMKNDAEKLVTVPMFLKDVATLWWRRRSEDVIRGRCSINTWEAFKKDLKKQFYPENAEEEARRKLHNLRQRGGIREYVSEFTAVLLEIPDVGERESLYAFLEGLERWARMELKRRGVQDLTQAMAAAEALIEFSDRDSSKSRGKTKDKKEYSAKSGGDSDGSADEGSSPRSKKSKAKGLDKGKGKVFNQAKSGTGMVKFECFICGGPHKARECPTKAKLNALLQMEKGPEDAQMNSVQLTSMATEGSKQFGRSMYADMVIEGHKLKGLVDTGATTVFIAHRVATKLGLPITPTGGQVKAPNSEPSRVYGVVQKADVRIGEWQDQVDLTVVDIDVYDVLIGAEFFHQAGAALMPYCNVMLLTKGKNLQSPIFIQLSRSDEASSKEISSLRCSMASLAYHPTLAKGGEGKTEARGEPKRSRNRGKKNRGVLEGVRDLARGGLSKDPPREMEDHDRKKKSKVASSDKRPGELRVQLGLGASRSTRVPCCGATTEPGVGQGVEHQMGQSSSGSMDLVGKESCQGSSGRVSAKIKGKISSGARRARDNATLLEEENQRRGLECRVRNGGLRDEDQPELQRRQGLSGGERPSDEGIARLSGGECHGRVCRAKEYGSDQTQRFGQTWQTRDRLRSGMFWAHWAKANGRMGMQLKKAPDLSRKILEDLRVSEEIRMRSGRLESCWDLSKGIRIGSRLLGFVTPNLICKMKEASGD